MKITGNNKSGKVCARHVLFLLTLCLWFLSTHNASAQLDQLRRTEAKARRVENQAKRAKRDINRLFSQEKREVSPEENLMDSIIWEMPRYIPQRGMLNDYAYFYKSVNGGKDWSKITSEVGLCRFFSISGNLWILLTSATYKSPFFRATPLGICQSSTRTYFSSATLF